MMNSLAGIAGSKSILQRLMVLLAHSKEDICIQNYNPCADVLELEQALRTFGYQVCPNDAGLYFSFCPALHANSLHQYHFQASATAYRLWLSVVANLPGIESRVSASPVLFQRGIIPLCDALVSLGAEYSLKGSELCIKGSRLQGGKLYIDTEISSQYASSLLLAAPFMRHNLRLQLGSILVSRPYLQLTLQMLQSFAASVDSTEQMILVQRGDFALPAQFQVDADLSTAAFYAVRAALGKDIQDLHLFLHPSYHQADAAIWDILRKMGANIQLEANVYSLHPAPLQGLELDLTDNPDLMPVLSIAALFCQSPMHLRGIARLAYKESNRVQGICKALDLLDAKYELSEDLLSIWPYTATMPAVVLDTQQDHRLVMAFSLLNERFPQVRLREWQSLSKSIPSC